MNAQMVFFFLVMITDAPSNRLSLSICVVWSLSLSPSLSPSLFLSHTLCHSARVSVLMLLCERCVCLFMRGVMEGLRLGLREDRMGVEMDGGMEGWRDGGMEG